MKDHVKTGAIFRLKNTAALKHTRPPTSRPSAFARGGKGASGPVASGSAPRRRVVGISKPLGNSAVTRMAEKSFSKGSKVLLQRHLSAKQEEEAEEGQEAGDEESVTSGDDSLSPSPERVVRKAKRVIPDVSASSSKDEESVKEEENSSGEGEDSEEREDREDSEESEESEDSEEEEKEREAAKRKAPARRTQVKEKATLPVKRKNASRAAAKKESPAPRKRRASATQAVSSSGDQTEIQSRTTSPKRKAPRKPRRRSTAMSESDDSEEEYSVKKKSPKKTSETQSGVRSSGRRNRRPVTQWWAANPDTGIDLGCHPESKPRKRLSEPKSERKAGAREASGSPPAKKRAASRRKPQSEPKKRRKQSSIEKEVDQLPMELPKPVFINENDDDSPVLKQSPFVKASPAKKIASVLRRGIRLTPLNTGRNLDSPHLTPITPMRASRLVQALFTFDGEGGAELTTSSSNETTPDSSGVPLQPLRSSHDEFGMPSLPYPGTAAMADADWYTLEQ